MKKLQDAIYLTIDKIIAQRLKEFKHDMTMKGVVTKVAHPLYIINIDGDKFTCKTLNDYRYSVGDTVYVLQPKFSSNEKIILGYVGR